MLDAVCYLCIQGIAASGVPSSKIRRASVPLVKIIIALKERVWGGGGLNLLHHVGLDKFLTMHLPKEGRRNVRC